MYFITSIMENNEGSRCIGYYSTKEEAINAVEENRCDINEAGYYPYVVVENIDEGLYQYDYRPIWFTWDNILKTYVKSEKPECMDKHDVGYAIG